ncbi:MAG TPA: response regulator transcription factor [Bacillota bacterium]|nr:response regulator transcription factor [Bacillota bacterium]
MGIRVILADDHRIMREGLRSLLQNQPDIEVIAEAADGQGAVKLARELSPDVVVIDVVMPNLNGLEATRKIVENNPGTKVVALSMYSNRSYVIEMLRAGASGYLLKDCAFEELVSAINAAVEDRYYLSPAVAGIVIKDLVDSLPAKGDNSVFAVLTSREREVLQLLAEGKTTSQISSALYLSEKTVESHRRQIMRKVGVKSIAKLTKYAIREGLTSLEF